MGAAALFKLGKSYWYFTAYILIKTDSCREQVIVQNPEVLWGLV